MARLELRVPSATPWSASVGGLLLGVAMLYHISLAGTEVDSTDAAVLLDDLIVVSPLETAGLAVVALAALGFAGWIRFGNREPYAFLGTIMGAFVSLGYTIYVLFTTPGGYFVPGVTRPAISPTLHLANLTAVAAILFLLAVASYLWRMIDIFSSR